jgi:excisionase family DNA binding protein
MPEMTMAEAAETLGISLDTIRRRVRRGELPHRRDERGRNVVNITDEEPVQLPVQLPVHARADDALVHVQELLAAIELRGDLLAAEVETLTHQLEARTTAEQELRVLLLRQSEEIERQSEQLNRLLPPPRTAEPDEPQPTPAPRAPQPAPAPAQAAQQPQRRRKPSRWWRPWQR